MGFEIIIICGLPKAGTWLRVVRCMNHQRLHRANSRIRERSDKTAINIKHQVSGNLGNVHEIHTWVITCFSATLPNAFKQRTISLLIIHSAFIAVQYRVQGSGYFFHVKMPGYRLASLSAATTLHFTACCIQLLLSQNPTACIA